MHDTIVVFDRVRENSHIFRRIDYETLVNHSIVQTLDRSLTTQLTVMFTLTALALFGGASIVVIDDDVEIRHSIGLLLESWGCRQVSGASAAEVERKLEAQDLLPDALIVDYRLAESTSGLEAIHSLRRRFGRKLPALLITGTTNLALLVARAGDIPVAVKPVPPGKLRAFLSQALRQHSASQA